MSRVRVDRAVRQQLREIYRYSVERWGADRAADYIRALSDTFDAIAEGRCTSRRIDARLGVDGYVARHGRHLIYWRKLDDGIAVVAVLHERMMQRARLLTALADPP